MKDHVALIIGHRRKVLFIKRSAYKKFNPNKWGFPTGTKELNETLEDTAIREAQEELGIIIKPVKIIATIELHEFNDRLHLMVCKLKSGKAHIKDKEEMSELFWMSLEEFFTKYKDDQTGLVLPYLRKNTETWKKYF